MKRVITCVSLALVAGCTISLTPSDHASPSPGAGARASHRPTPEPSARKDVTVTSVHYSRGVATVRLQVHNHTSKTSNYNVYLVAENRSGSLQYDVVSTYMAYIKPKQNRVTEVFMNNVPKKAKVSIINVERWAS